MKIDSLNKGLIGHWPLDAKHSRSGMSLDISAYGNHGTWQGSIYYDTDRNGVESGSVRFIRSEAQINCGPVINQGDETTITCWFKTNFTGSSNGLFDFSGGVAGFRGHFDLHHAYNRPLWYLANENYMYFDESIQSYYDNNWHFFEFYFFGSDATSSELRIDTNVISGLLRSNPDSPLPFTNFYIGRGYNSISGSIADIRLYNRQLTDNERELLFSGVLKEQKLKFSSLLKGLTCEYSLTTDCLIDETLGSEILKDRTPYAHQAYNNGVAISGSSSLFIATNSENINCGNDTDYYTDAFTATIWLKTTSSLQQQLFIKQAYENDGFANFMSTAGMQRTWVHRDGSSNQFVDVNAINDGEWHLCGMFSDSGSRGIINNDIIYYDTEGVIPIPNSSSDLTIGGHNYGYFDGEMCYFRMWNRVLSEKEFMELHNMGRRPLNSKI